MNIINKKFTRHPSQIRRPQGEAVRKPSALDTFETTELPQFEESLDGARQTVYQAAKALGIEPDMMSSPEAMKTALKDLGLDEFQPSNPRYRDFFLNIKSKPQPMGPLLSRVMEGLTEDHPAVCEFLELSLEKNWLKPGPEVQQAVHHGYVLESLTQAMSNDVEFSKDVQNHLMEKRREYGINPNSVFGTLAKVAKKVGIFEAAKTISVDPAMQHLTVTRTYEGAPTQEQVDELHEAKEISWLTRQTLKPKKGPQENDQLGMRINVMEAAITDFKDGRTNNAFAGYILAEAAAQQKPTGGIEKGEVAPVPGVQEEPISALHENSGSENYFPHGGYDKDWTSLYETWNMAFVLGELDDPQVLLPKLLIPSVLCAEPEHYVGVRTESLWLSVNSYLLRRLNGVEPVKGPKNREEMARAWGEINKKYAMELAREDLHSTPTQAERDFEEDFQHPILGFVKLASGYF